MKKIAIITVLSTVLLAASAKNNTHNTGKKTKRAEVPENWKQLLDPKTDKFWADSGGHLPDPGALEFFKDPNDKTARLYLQRMNMKRDLAHKFSRLLAKANLDLIREGKIADDYGFLKQDSSKSSEDLVDQLKEFSIFFFFTPSCPHCKVQAKMLKGTNTFPFQVGGETLMHFKGLSKTSFATDEDKKKFLKEGQVPTLLLLHNPTNRLTKINGVTPVSDLVEVARNLEKGGN